MDFLNEVSRVYDQSEKIPFDDFSKFVIVSDVHRGDGSWADDFYPNQNLYFSALTYYYQQNFTYIENGDGDELWKFRKLSDIIRTHSHVFWLLSKFYEEHRLYFIYGNHDMVKKSKRFVAENMYDYFRERDEKTIDLFKGIDVHEGLILKHVKNKYELFILHGHQIDFFNNTLWKLARFLIRYLWRPLENIGFNNPTSPAKNYAKKQDVEHALIDWITENKCMLIAGHTHRPMLPDTSQPPYINSGSSVHPRCITAIELANGELTLVKWATKTKLDGTLYIGRELLAGPKKIEDYYLNFNVV